MEAVARRAAGLAEARRRSRSDSLPEPGAGMGASRERKRSQSLVLHLPPLHLARLQIQACRAFSSSNPSLSTTDLKSSTHLSTSNPSLLDIERIESASLLS